MCQRSSRENDEQSEMNGSSNEAPDALKAHAVPENRGAWTRGVDLSLAL